MRTLVLSLILAVAAAAAVAQQTVFLCDGTYTDKPCKGGKEVDIAPTRGAHSMSGKKRESTEARHERMRHDMDAAYRKGIQQGRDNMRCAQLQQRRQAIERAGRSDAMEGERLRIREEQFSLKCQRG